MLPSTLSCCVTTNFNCGVNMGEDEFALFGKARALMTHIMEAHSEQNTEAHSQQNMKQQWADSASTRNESRSKTLRYDMQISANSPYGKGCAAQSKFKYDDQYENGKGYNQKKARLGPWDQGARWC